MATLNDVRAICERLPGAIEGGPEHFAFGVMVKEKHKGFCWSWLERIDSKKARVINEGVLAVSTPNLGTKDLLVESGGPFFTEPHYNGYPAVLVRLADISLEELEDVLTEGWRTKASKAMQNEFDSDR